MSNRSSRAQKIAIALHLCSLKEVAALLGPHASVAALRAEVLAGRLRCIRLRPGPNSKILISQQALTDWLGEFAARRQFVSVSPTTTPTKNAVKPSK